MNAFFADIIHDLREKRLWPIAVALLIGLVAVPVLLAKPASDAGSTSAAPADPAPSASATDKTKPVVELADLKQIEKSSKLRVFDQKNPFKPKIKTIKLSDATANALTEVASTGKATAEGGSGATGGGSTGGGGDGGGTTNPTTPDAGGKTHVAQYTYVIDATLTHNGSTRKLKSVKRLTMLPNESNPALLFLGVSAKGDNAVFLVDSTLAAAGEGHCAPTGKTCATLSLGAGNEEDLVDGKGNSYTIRIDQIRKVKISHSASTAKSSKAKGARKASVASVGAPVRRFVPPILADLVSVATTDGVGSSSDKDRR